MAEIIIGAGHELVRVMDVPKLIALALHGLPARYPLEEPEEDDGPPTYDPSIWNDVLRIEDERGHRKDLLSAVSRGEVRLVTSPGRRPTSWGHHAHLTIDALAAYAAQFGVDVKVAKDEEPAEALAVAVADEAAPPALTAGDVAVRPERHSIKRRAAPLSAVLAEAQRQALDPGDWQSVWAALVKMAGSPSRPPPLLGYTEGEGVKYQTDIAERPDGWLKRQAFRKRFSRK